MDNKLTGTFISQRRKELSLNQKQLAEKLNVTDKAVSKWETGRSAPDISMLMPLSEVIVNRVADRFSDIYEDTENLQIVKQEKKGDYYFYLLRNESVVIMATFEKDKLFNDRIAFGGGQGSAEANEIGLYSCGMNRHSINVFFGYGMTDEAYTYYYRGVKSTKLIEDEYILDVFIDYDDSFTNACIIYND